MKHRAQKFQRSIVFLLKIFLYFVLFSIFFLLFSIDYPYILKLSRTAAITMVTFVVLGTALLSVYGGYAIGKQKSKPIIHSMVLATIITDLITYLEFCIMNASPANNYAFRFAAPEILLLIVVLQVIFIIIWAYVGNYIFFTMNPPEQVCIITSSKKSLNQVLPKIRKYKKQYQVKDIIDYTSEDIYLAIDRNDTVFLYDVPVRERTYLIEYCYDHMKNIYYNPEICDVVAVNAKHVVLDDKSFVSLVIKDLSFEQRFVKRMIDLLLSTLGLIISSPILIISAVAIKICDHGPVFFKQKRATKDGRIFEVYKFRTMKEHVENVSAKEDDDRITSVGKVLRKTRMDELPQIFNILKGDMSIVGPRPEMMENVLKYTRELPEFAYRLRVKAGLTGYAQIVGKYNTSPKDKLFLDLMYIENYSIWLDIKLIFQTLIVFLKTDSTEGFKEQPQIEFVKYDPSKK
ncbi:Putative colanic biosynthesis UDP-glucose lipid carrier transferase [uncultured Ruminococcus sp.]|uniref:exopolysaccharide biosynthesis polyprenyl glycosylphosphotransferase n=1 Tax=Massiliimalia timonensis TaxID=1987501 RepID=UPI000822DD7D|nr:exopolysaccharide biosynthesis polyprenyl glycosylphosphotransferase [Massiliimalia timonensis]SCH02827.1 Putative colanic biosynthesis UDP-glucose lipid carrier transferase [uncultured Ruminococcus sp.]SCH73126.1 Putative colanic biosynthesis UDP-glucose lipid carrier transferase [uncultured Clostridium sp.]